MENINIRLEGQPIDPIFPYQKSHQDLFTRGERNYYTLINPDRHVKGLKAQFNSPSSGVSLDLSKVDNLRSYIDTVGETVTNLETELKRSRNNRDRTEGLDEVRANLVGFGKAAFNNGDYYHAILAFDTARILDNPHVEQIVKEYITDAGKDAKEEVIKAYLAVRRIREDRIDSIQPVNDMITFFRTRGR